MNTVRAQVCPPSPASTRHPAAIEGPRVCLLPTCWLSRQDAPRLVTATDSSPIAHRVERLVEAARALRAGEFAVRADVHAGLRALRGEYRRNPSEFSTDLVGMLQSVAAALTESPTL